MLPATTIKVSLNYVGWGIWVHVYGNISVFGRGKIKMDCRFQVCEKLIKVRKVTRKKGTFARKILCVVNRWTKRTENDWPCLENYVVRNATIDCTNNWWEKIWGFRNIHAWESYCRISIDIPIEIQHFNSQAWMSAKRTIRNILNSEKVMVRVSERRAILVDRESGWKKRCTCGYRKWINEEEHMCRVYERREILV